MSTRLVWVTIVLLGDYDDNVRASLAGVARRANVSIQEATDAMNWLAASDPFSDITDFDGRKIEVTDFGWRILGLEVPLENRLDRAESSKPTRDRSSRVYFIRSGDHVKIGFSRNPEARMESLRAGLAHAPVLLGHTEAMMQDERRLHKKFNHIRKHGEWFDATPELLNFIPKWLAKKEAENAIEAAEMDEDETGEPEIMPTGEPAQSL